VTDVILLLDGLWTGSIWRGTGATLARDGPGSAAYFVAYEAAKKALTPAGSDPSKLNLTAVILAGGTAGVAMWSIAIPPDVSSSIPSAPAVLAASSFCRGFIRKDMRTTWNWSLTYFVDVQTLKSRLQSAPHGTYNGFIDCARKTIAADGVGALWKGTSTLSPPLSPSLVAWLTHRALSDTQDSDLPCLEPSLPVRPFPLLLYHLVFYFLHLYWRLILPSTHPDAATFLGYELAVKGMESFGL
jgi:hypothetical protein